MKKKWWMVAGITSLVVAGGVYGFTQLAYAEDAPKVTMKQAEELALKEVSGGKIESIEMDRKLNGWEYELEVKDDNATETEVKVNAMTGEVVKVKTDDDSFLASYLPEVKLSQEEAVAIALEQTPGNVTKVEREWNQFEVEIREGATEYKYEIDANTGAVLEFDQEQEDGED